MKALAKIKSEPGIWLTDFAFPSLNDTEVLIKIKKTAICGTDLHITEWNEWAQKTIKIPLIIGHEFMGEVMAVGNAVTEFKRGDRVSGEGHITCGKCRNCRAGLRHLCPHTQGTGVNRAGSFAEYLVFPETNIFKLPAFINDDIASILDPFGNATHCALLFDMVGEDVLITGAGPVGLMATAIARHIGARHIVVTDINPYRLSIAKKMGATLALDAQANLKEAMKTLGMTAGFDIGLEMSGASGAFINMLEVMNHGGKIAFLGVPNQSFAIEWAEVIFKGLTIQGVYGRKMFDTWYKMASMLSSGLDISPVITHHFPVSEFQAAFEAAKKGKTGKIILAW